MVRDGRIIEWGLGDKVEALVDDGVKDPRAIAHKLQADAYAAAQAGREKILTSDVRNYMQSVHRRREEAKAKSLAYSREGREVVETAREHVIWLAEQADSIKPVLGRFIKTLEKVEEQYRLSLDTDEPLPVPRDHIEAIERLSKVMRDLFGGVLGDSKLQQLIKSQTINVNQGISEERLFELLSEMGKYLTCKACNRSFTTDEVSAAFARAQRALRERDRVIDAQVPTD